MWNAPETSMQHVIGERNLFEMSKSRIFVPWFSSSAWKEKLIKKLTSVEALISGRTRKVGVPNKRSLKKENVKKNKGRSHENSMSPFQEDNYKILRTFSYYIITTLQEICETHARYLYNINDHKDSFRCKVGFIIDDYCIGQL